MNLNEEKKCQNLKKHILNELYVKEEEIQKLENEIRIQMKEKKVQDK